MASSDDYEREAWAAFLQARKDWQRRDAPSVGARARSILRNLMMPPSYINACLVALDLYLAPWQKVEHGDMGRQPRRGPEHAVDTPELSANDA